MKRRVVITGLGVVTPLGHQVDVYWKGLLEGANAVDTLQNFSPERLLVRFGAEIRGFNPLDYFSKSEANRMDRVSHFAVVAAMSAIEDSGLELEKMDRTRVGVIMGTGIGGVIEHWEQTMVFLEKGARRVSPFFIPRLMPNAVAANISIKMNLQGPTFSVNTACASAGNAQILSAQAIETGQADVVLTGGSEAILSELAISGFASCRALSRRNDDPKRACRPFDRERDGFVMGEGAAVIVFEELEHARRRGAKIYAEYLGSGFSNDGYHITAPEPSGRGPARAMEEALKSARLNPEQIDYINAHGTSTPYNDAIETKAIHQVFGEYAKKIPISSTKSMVGHLIGAAGAVELVATVLSICEDKIHPTINYEFPDPECDLDYVPNEARDHRVRYALSNSFGFGGHNVSVAVGKFLD